MALFPLGLSVEIIPITWLELDVQPQFSGIYHHIQTLNQVHENRDSEIGIQEHSPLLLIVSYKYSDSPVFGSHMSSFNWKSFSNTSSLSTDSTSSLLPAKFLYFRPASIFFYNLQSLSIERIIFHWDLSILIYKSVLISSSSSLVRLGKDKFLSDIYLLICLYPTWETPLCISIFDSRSCPRPSIWAHYVALGTMSGTTTQLRTGPLPSLPLRRTRWNLRNPHPFQHRFPIPYKLVQAEPPYQQQTRSALSLDLRPLKQMVLATG